MLCVLLVSLRPLRALAVYRRVRWASNARPELLPEAGAERTLEAVSSRPLFGPYAAAQCFLRASAPTT